MDGTLIHGSSANMALAKEMGLVDEFRALDAEFLAGVIGVPEYARQAYGMWSSCAHAMGVTRADCVAYGDSLSDAALFAAVPVSVAINGDHHVSDLATHAYTGRDLRDAYGMVADRE
jgi:phosphoserine phosphatase